MKSDPTIKTNIQRFDDGVLNGGIPQEHIVLICGAAGTYKSSLSLNLLSHNIKNDGKRGLYISLEEPRESLKLTAQNLGLWDGGMDQEKLLIADLGKLRLDHQENSEFEKNWFTIIKEYIQNRISEGYELVVLDSLSALYSLIEIDNPRKELFEFFGFLRDQNISVFLISEVPGGSDGYGEYSEDFLSDGIIYLKHFNISDTESQLRIKCVKMRHVNHSKDYFTLLFDKGQFKIAKVISDLSNR